VALAVGRDEIIGRRDELVAVDAMLDQAEGGFAALVLEGEPGIGKTALWEAGRAAAEQRGFRTLSSRPARSDAQLTLARTWLVAVAVAVAGVQLVKRAQDRVPRHDDHGQQSQQHPAPDG